MTLDVAVPRSEELVGTAAGIPAPAPVRWSVITRAQWAEANLGSMEQMIKPLADKVGGRLDSLPFPVRLAQRTIVSVEMGVLLGYISRRVLGQYDLLVPDEAPGDLQRLMRAHAQAGNRAEALRVFELRLQEELTAAGIDDVYVAEEQIVGRTGEALFGADIARQQDATDRQAPAAKFARQT